MNPVRIAGQDRETEETKESRIDVGDIRLILLFSQKERALSFSTDKSRILDLRELFAKSIAQRSTSPVSFLHKPAVIKFIDCHHPINGVRIFLEIFKCQLIHHPEVNQESSRHPQYKTQHIDRRKQETPFYQPECDLYIMFKHRHSICLIQIITQRPCHFRKILISNQIRTTPFKMIVRIRTPYVQKRTNRTIWPSRYFRILKHIDPPARKI